MTALLSTTVQSAYDRPTRLEIVKGDRLDYGNGGFEWDTIFAIETVEDARRALAYYATDPNRHRITNSDRLVKI